MHSLKNKFLKFLTVMAVVFGTVLFSEMTAQYFGVGIQDVHASTVVYGEGVTTFSANINDPESPSGYGTNNIYNFYISKDGQTRYVQERFGTNETWYKWNPDESKKYGGEWVVVNEKIIPQTSKDIESLKKYLNQNMVIHIQLLRAS